MYKLFLALALFAGSQSIAYAQNRMALSYECYLVDDFDDWVLNVDNKKAGFFDNDHWSALKFSHIKKGWYVYRGQDSMFKTTLYAVLKPHSTNRRLAKAFIIEKGAKYEMNCKFKARQKYKKLR